MTGRILAVDPGEKRIGLAISDPSATLARPLSILQHESREIDAQKIIENAQQNEVILIVIGIPLDMEGRVGPKAKRSERLADQIRLLSNIPLELWDETGSTQKAHQIIKQVKKRKKKNQLQFVDDVAAAVILQSYLDEHHI